MEAEEGAVTVPVGFIFLLYIRSTDGPLTCTPPKERSAEGSQSKSNSQSSPRLSKLLGPLRETDPNSGKAQPPHCTQHSSDSE